MLRTFFQLRCLRLLQSPAPPGSPREITHQRIPLPCFAFLSCHALLIRTISLKKVCIQGHKLGNGFDNCCLYCSWSVLFPVINGLLIVSGILQMSGIQARHGLDFSGQMHFDPFQEMIEGYCWSYQFSLPSSTPLLQISLPKLFTARCLLAQQSQGQESMLVTLVSNVFIPDIKENEYFFCKRAIVEVGMTCLVFLIRGQVGEGFYQFIPVSPVPLGGFSLSLSAYSFLHMPNCSFFVTCKFILLVIHVLKLLWEYL